MYVCIYLHMYVLVSVNSVTCEILVLKYFRLSAVFGMRFEGDVEIRTSGIQAAFQVALLASTLVIAILGGLLAGEILVETRIYVSFPQFLTVYHPNLFAGVTARFLGHFCQVDEKEFFDDNPFWEVSQK